MKPYPNEELERMSKREIIRLYKRTVEQFNDAVPVIRCKDCRFLREQYLCINGNNFPAHWCKQWAGIVPESGFCHLAERKEE